MEGCVHPPSARDAPPSIWSISSPPAARDSNLGCVWGCGWGAVCPDFARTSPRPPGARRPAPGAAHLASVRIPERPLWRPQRPLWRPQRPLWRPQRPLWRPQRPLWRPQRPSGAVLRGLWPEAGSGPKSGFFQKWPRSLRGAPGASPESPGASGGLPVPPWGPMGPHGAPWGPMGPRCAAGLARSALYSC